MLHDDRSAANLQKILHSPSYRVPIVTWIHRSGMRPADRVELLGPEIAFLDHNTSTIVARQKRIEPRAKAQLQTH